jgi:hypothetical protein
MGEWENEESVMNTNRSLDRKPDIVIKTLQYLGMGTQEK